MLNKLQFYTLTCLVLLLGSSCEKSPEELVEETAISKYVTSLVFDLEATSSGLYYWTDDEAPGAGEVASVGDTIVMHYKGKILTITNGSDYFIYLETPEDESFEYIVGKTKVFAGLEEGFSKLKDKAVATMIIPSELAYGDKQVGLVPANSPLIFEVKVDSIIRKK